MTAEAGRMSRLPTRVFVDASSQVVLAGTRLVSGPDDDSHRGRFTKVEVLGHLKPFRSAGTTMSLPMHHQQEGRIDLHVFHAATHESIQLFAAQCPLLDQGLGNALD